jgi:hypothetical protein
MGQPGTVKITAKSFEWLAVSTTKLPYPHPLSEKAPNPEGFAFWWTMMETVFELPNPAEFPPFSLPPKTADRQVLERFIHAAEEISQSQLLSEGGGMTVNFTPDGIENVETDFVTSEITRGFTTLLRQMHSNEKSDPARFVRVLEILKQTNERGKDELMGERDRLLGLWRKARASLLQETLKVRVGQKLRDQGRMPPGIPGEGGMSPQTLITAYQYGDLIHWGHPRSVIEDIADDPFESAHQQMNFMEAVSGLAHLYMGFSVLVKAALREETTKGWPRK